MSSPFDPDRWPAGYGPASGSGSAGGADGGGGDEPPPFDDEDAPPPLDDEDAPSADTSTGELLPSGPEDPAAAPPLKPKQDPRAAFLQWVSEQIGQVEAYQQPIAQKSAWCPEWWKHPEVVQRLYVSWKAYQQAIERMREDKGAKSAWWVQHWDQHARVLFDKERGPFRACNQAGHLADNDGKPLPIGVELPPEDARLI